MFIAFIQKKGWLKFPGMEENEYLESLWRDYQPKKKEDSNFYTDRLAHLFFRGLNNASAIDMLATNRGRSAPDSFLQRRIGDVPYLNGGLFEKSDDGTDDDTAIVIPDKAINAVLHELFARFNFTVTESTPLDAVARFVDEHDASALRDGEGVLEALKTVKCCDPACGSGAYLLGMMHELLDLRQTLFKTNQKLDSISTYDRKLEIIQTNVYGVDLDPFAVNIARLRLWLSLAVDFDGDAPPPLPNLDFKIESGDSLAAPDPSESGQLQLQKTLVDEFLELKREYLLAHSTRKKELKKQIDKKREQIKAWTHASGALPENAFDWQVEFAEVFLGGGFDVVLANPPYVRQELIKEQKPLLRQNFAASYNGVADLYIYFYSRAIQLLSVGGNLAFISSNKWLRATYAQGFRKYFADAAFVRTLVDFGHAKQIFRSADVFPVIAVARRKQGPGGGLSRVAYIGRDELRMDDLTQQFHKLAHNVPLDHFSAGPWLLDRTDDLALLQKLEQNGVALREFVGKPPVAGFATGCNDAFVIDAETRDELIRRDPRSAEIIKPYARGQDLDRWHAASSGMYIIFTRRGTKVEHYPAIRRHLSKYRRELEPRPLDVSDDDWPGRKPGNYAWYEIQDSAESWRDLLQPKIVYADIAWQPAIAFDTAGTFFSKTVYYVPTDDLWIAAVLNSPIGWWYAWRAAVHGKDDALRFLKPFVEKFPIPRPTESQRQAVEPAIRRLIVLAQERQRDREPGEEALALEQRISGIVNDAFGLTKADEELMWKTAPPRMPFVPALEGASRGSA